MRCNCGIDPIYLADQHVIVEARELGMVAGSLKYNDMKVVGAIPMKLSLGKGHLNFFKDKLAYLHKRWLIVKKECERRGFNIQKPFYDLSEFPQQYVNDWTPNQNDTMILRGRITEKLNMKPDWYRYEGSYITAEKMPEFCRKMQESPLYYV
jgi:deoxyribonuclease (pyrimidine dimer)